VLVLITKQEWKGSDGTRGDGKVAEGESKSRMTVVGKLQVLKMGIRGKKISDVIFF
jgi:hypothetical protein